MIYFCYNFFDSANETNKYEIKSRRLHSYILTCFNFLNLFLKNDGFTQEGNPPKKAVLVEKEIDGIDIDDIRNSEDLPRLVFIDEKCENLIVVNDGGELTRNINQKFYSSL